MKRRFNTLMYSISAKDNKTIIINNSGEMVRLFLIFPGLPMTTLKVQPGAIRICIHQKRLAEEVVQKDKYTEKLNCSLALVHHYKLNFEIKKEKGKNLFEIKEKHITMKSLQWISKIVLYKNTEENLTRLPNSIQKELCIPIKTFYFLSHLNYVETRLGLIYRRGYRTITKIPSCFCSKQC